MLTAEPPRTRPVRVKPVRRPSRSGSLWGRGVVAVSLALGVVILTVDRRERVNQIYASLAFAMAWWALTSLGVAFSSSEAMALTTSRPTRVTISFLPEQEMMRSSVYSETMNSMAAAAMKTSRIRLGTGVLVPSNRIAAIAKYHASQTAKMCADKAQQIFGGYGMAREYRVSWLKSYADLFFTGEGSANVQKILIAEDALGYKVADRHHGRTGLRDVRATDVASETR